MKAASEIPLDADDVLGSLKALDLAADEFFDDLLDKYLDAYSRGSKAGERYLKSVVAQKARDMDEWHRKQHEAGHHAAIVERVRNVGGAVLQSAKTVGLISAKGLTVIAPPVGKWLDLSYTGADVYGEIAEHKSVLLVVGKEAAKKGTETAAETASEHLAEHIEEKAAKAWSEAATKKPWAIGQPTSRYVQAIDRAHTVKIAGKAVGWAFTVYDVTKAIHETYEAWEKVFEHEEKSHGEHH
jgi:hypothetical protein